jgi:ATP-dependent HslUV protease ATP-binding subunit HslU
VSRAVVKTPHEPTPAEVVTELDRHVIGQTAAKRAVAIAVRNRWRRMRLPEDLRDEVTPGNIIMIGPTGVGKTEIARRLSKLVGAPMIKVEASKFTEVGYVGRDVESIVRDLTDAAMAKVRAEHETAVQKPAREAAVERLVDILLPRPRATEPRAEGEEDPIAKHERARERMRSALTAGRLDAREVEIDTAVTGSPTVDVFTAQGVEQLGIDLREVLGSMVPRQRRKRKVTVADALDMLTAEEAARMVDREAVKREAVRRVEESGIVIIDELDKVAGREQGGHGPDVSREGVQRDLLPIVEGTSVMTKHGTVSTDHILFIACGAFNVAKPTDLIPELQGRFPIRVELSALDTDDLQRILVEPEHSLLRQYEGMLATEGVKLTVDDSGVREIAAVAADVNSRTENIGARRLHTVLTTLLEDLLFEAPDCKGERAVFDGAEVRRRLEPILKDTDLSSYIL